MGIGENCQTYLLLTGDSAMTEIYITLIFMQRWHLHMSYSLVTQEQESQKLANSSLVGNVLLACGTLSAGRNGML